jgi:hypothetical protein
MNHIVEKSSTRRVPVSLGLAFVLLAASVTSSPARASMPIAWKTTNYAIAPGNMPLRQVLTDLQRTLGVSVELTSDVQGTVSSTGDAAMVDSFLNKLAATHGLSWFVFRNRLYVSRESESQEAYVSMPAAQAGELRNYLNGLKLLEEKFGWVETPSRSDVIVIGPPAYVRLVKQYASNMSRLKPALNTVAEPLATMTFKLRYASAADAPMTPDGVSRPGVATLLSKIYGANMYSSGMASGGRNLVSEATAASLRDRQELREATRSGANAAGVVGGGISSLFDGRGSPASTSDASEDDASLPSFASTPAQRAQPLMRFGPSLSDGQSSGPRTPANEPPTIEADERLNMLVIRDKASKRAEYARLIAELDVSTSQLVFDAMVIRLIFGTLANLPRQGPNGSSLLIPRPVAESLYLALRAAKRCDPDAAAISQSVVFKEGGHFSLDFNDQLRYPENSTPFWYALLSQLAPLPKEQADRTRKIGLKVAGLARAVPDRRVELTMDLSEERDSPNAHDKTVSQRSTETSLSIELAEDEVLMLSEGLAWSGSDMKTARSRLVLLSARRWSRDDAAIRASDGASLAAMEPQAPSCVVAMSPSR